MKKLRWSALYPLAWRKEFGDEFDAMVEMSGVTWREAVDIIRHALRLRCSSAVRGLPFLGAWLIVAWLNVFAREVQWPAGALVLTAFIWSIWHRERWLRNTLVLFCSIPISSLYYYQIPGIHHEPLYKTAVALIPAFFGAGMGLLMAPGKPPSEMRKLQ